MSRSWDKIFRASILKLTAYSSARSIAKKSLAEATQFMDANERPLAPSLTTGMPWETTLNRYPAPQPLELLTAFSNLYGVPAKNILITRGSDEAIDVLTRAVCEPVSSTTKNDAILITPPTYGMYEVSADIQNTAVEKVPLLLKDNQWSLDLDAIKTKLTGATTQIKIVYICSPNNPTGTAFSKNQIHSLLETLPAQTLLVLDEAYIEFSSETSPIEWLSQFPQLVILRTLSKAWGLAGLRCGTLIGNEELVELLQKVRAPYPIPTPIAELALQALRGEGESLMRKNVAEIIQERENLKQELLKLPQTVCVYPSETNFLLVEFNDAGLVMKLSGDHGIVLRDRSGQVANCVRITVGTKDENKNLLTSLQKMSSL